MPVFNLLLHVIWASLMFSILNHSGIPKLNFDSISVGLTILEIVLIVGGVFAFLEIRSRSETAAKKTAEAVCPDLVEKLFVSYINDDLPAQVRAHIDTLMPQRFPDEADSGEGVNDEI